MTERARRRHAVWGQGAAGWRMVTPVWHGVGPVPIPAWTPKRLRPKCGAKARKGSVLSADDRRQLLEDSLVRDAAVPVVPNTHGLARV